MGSSTEEEAAANAATVHHIAEHNGKLFTADVLQNLISKNGGKSSALMTILQTANPYTVKRILILLHSLIKKNKKDIKTFKMTYARARKKKRLLTKKLNQYLSKRGVKSVYIQNRKKAEKRLHVQMNSLSNRLSHLDRQIDLAKRYLSNADAQRRDAAKIASKQFQISQRKLNLLEGSLEWLRDFFQGREEAENSKY